MAGVRAGVAAQNRDSAVNRSMKMLPRLLISLLLCMVCEGSGAEPNGWKFDFGGEAAPGATTVRPDLLFSSEKGHGFEPGSVVKATARGGGDKLRDGFVTSEKPFLFSVAVPEGLYRVTVVLGDAQDTSLTTIKAEARRLMAEKVETVKGEFETCVFNVAVKRPELEGGGKVQLKPAEMDGHRDWDDKLTLEFSNARPCLCSLEIVPVQNVTTIYIAGDSTVTNQRNEPWAGWGQMLPRFFTEAVVVSNHAQSGLALFSFERQRRLEKIVNTMNKGDYLFIQFGHNDQKDKRADAGPFTTYKQNLKRFVEAVRNKGGIPVLVTPMERRRFDENGRQTTTLAEYSEAVKQVGAEEKAPVIDLNAMSLKLYAALGPKGSAKAFAHYPANSFPGQERALEDDTHHNAYGAYELARCVVEGIKAHVPALAGVLRNDLGSFDPAKPDAPEKFDLPGSPVAGWMEKPAGS
jgi:lysophospholipase L1-like esterase